MLNLPKRKSTFNFYESFSDLVFCALVMFLVLVLFLAMNVNQKQTQVEVGLEEVTRTLAEAETEAQQARQEAQALRAKAEQEAEQARQALLENQRLRIEALSLRDSELAEIEKQRKQIIADAQRLMDQEREQIAAERKKLDARRAEVRAEQAKMEAALDLRRSRLAEMERDLDQQRRLYEQALGMNRFTGLPQTPRLVVAYDWQPTRIAVHPVPAWLIEALNTTPPGLDAPSLAAYYAKQRGVFLQVAEQVEPLTPRQYRALIRSITIGREPVPRVGERQRLSLDLVFANDAQGNATTTVERVLPGGNAAKAGILEGDTLISIDQQPVTPQSLPGLLDGFEPGDTARLLVRRDGKPQTIQVVFGQMRLVELIEAYRTDLSMVVSGALDTDYTYLWAPPRADALRTQVQQGQAAEVIWQGTSRWQGRETTDGRPVLKFDAAADGKGAIIGGEAFTVAQFRRVLESIGGGGLIVEYTPELGPDELPEAIYDQALRPTGFVIRAPQLDKLLGETE